MLACWEGAAQGAWLLQQELGCHPAARGHLNHLQQLATQPGSRSGLVGPPAAPEKRWHSVEHPGQGRAISEPWSETRRGRPARSRVPAVPRSWPGPSPASQGAGLRPALALCGQSWVVAHWRRLLPREDVSRGFRPLSRCGSLSGPDLALVALVGRLPSEDEPPGHGCAGARASGARARLQAGVRVLEAGW